MEAASISKQANFETHPFKYSFTTCFKDQVILKTLGKSFKGKVLEMGCGSGYFGSVLASTYGADSFSYTGVDISAESLKAAQQYLPTSAKLIEASVTEMPLPSDEFDEIFYLDVIEHVPDDVASLREALRVLKPGGRLVISTPNEAALLTDTFFCEYMHDHGHMENHRAGYTADALSAMLVQQGFKIESTSYSNVLLSEFLITATKLGYRLKKPKYSSQADMVEVSDSFLFDLHKRFFFPLGYAIGRAEEMLLKRFLDGHCLIISARKV